MPVLRKLLGITLPVLVVCLLLAELVFRFLIPAAELPKSRFDRGVMKFDVHGPRSGVFSVGSFAEGRGRWRINNDGWNSAIDYSRDSRRPLIAIIGDSFVEAVHVDADKNFGALVRRDLEGAAEVYTLGASGTPLSGYLALARYAKREFRPDVLVLNVVYNDFAESVYALQPNPSFLQFDLRGNEVVEVSPRGYTSSSLRRTLRHSALARWVVINCKLTRNFSRAFDRQGSQAAFLLRQRPVIEPVADAIFARLQAENPGIPVIVLLDGPRQRMFADERSQERLRWIPAMMRRLSRKYGFEFIDLERRLEESSVRTGKRVDYESDYHWNEAGHRLAADALLLALRRRGLAP